MPVLRLFDKRGCYALIAIACESSLPPVVEVVDGPVAVADGVLASSLYGCGDEVLGIAGGIIEILAMGKCGCECRRHGASCAVGVAGLAAA